MGGRRGSDEGGSVGRGGVVGSSAGGERGARRRAEGVGAPLSMNSLMDIMTIILCFLLSSYGDNPIAVKSSPDLELSRSTTELSPQDTLTITVTRKAIIVGDQLAAVVRDGAAEGRRGGTGAARQGIPALRERLTAEVSRHLRMAALKQAPWDGVATIVADRTVPYRLVTEVMVTAGQAQVETFKFATVSIRRRAGG